MSEAHDTAYAILSSHPAQMHLMASVLLERETVDGEACQALLDNKWDEYLAHEDEIIARKEAEEAEARARDARLADPNWREKEQAAMQNAYGMPMGNGAPMVGQPGMQAQQQQQPMVQPQQTQVPVQQQTEVPVVVPPSETANQPVSTLNIPEVQQLQPEQAARPELNNLPEVDRRFDPGYTEQAPAPTYPEDWQPPAANPSDEEKR